MRRMLVANFDVCTGCHACELACAFEKEGGYNPRFARLTVVSSSDGLWNDVVVCAQCENPACARTCPTGAIVRNEQEGVVLIDTSLCTGCDLCGRYCHRGIMKFYGRSEGGRAYKCDLCSGRVPCVRTCPTGALRLVEFV